MFERRRPSIVLAGTAVCLLAVLHICAAEQQAAAVAARSKRGVSFLQGSGNGVRIGEQAATGAGAADNQSLLVLTDVWSFSIL